MYTMVTSPLSSLHAILPASKYFKVCESCVRSQRSVRCDRPPALQGRRARQEMRQRGLEPFSFSEVYPAQAVVHIPWNTTHSVRRFLLIRTSFFQWYINCFDNTCCIFFSTLTEFNCGISQQVTPTVLGFVNQAIRSLGWSRKKTSWIRSYVMVGS